MIRKVKIVRHKGGYGRSCFRNGEIITIDTKLKYLVGEHYGEWKNPDLKPGLTNAESVLSYYYEIEQLIQSKVLSSLMEVIN